MTRMGLGRHTPKKAEPYVPGLDDPAPISAFTGEV
jgi:hypothetical protein